MILQKFTTTWKISEDIEKLVINDDYKNEWKSQSTRTTKNLQELLAIHDNQQKSANKKYLMGKYKNL